MLCYASVYTAVIYVPKLQTFVSLIWYTQHTAQSNTIWSVF